MILLYTAVAYFADLTAYSYWASSTSYAPNRDEPWPLLPLVNVGWLDAEHPFATGVPPEGLLVRLGELARVRVMQTRGYHLCELCIRDLGGPAELKSLDSAARDEVFASVPCESAEFRVKGSGVIYAVPQLALHYVSTHQYLPPPEFCAAVMNSPVARDVSDGKQVEPVVIVDYCEALALHKMLMRAKLEWDADDEYVGSPYIAAVQRRLVEALQAATPGPGWAKWREATEHEWRLPRIRAYLARTLPSLPAHLRRRHVLDVFAPLLPSDELVDELLAEAAP